LRPCRGFRRGARPGRRECVKAPQHGRPRQADKVRELACGHLSIFGHAEMDRGTEQGVGCTGAEAFFNMRSVDAAHLSSQFDPEPGEDVELGAGMHPLAVPPRPTDSQARNGCARNAPQQSAAWEKQHGRGGSEVSQRVAEIEARGFVVQRRSIRLNRCCLSLISFWRKRAPLAND